MEDEGATYLQLEKISQLANFSNINSREETVTEVDLQVLRGGPGPLVAQILHGAGTFFIFFVRLVHGCL